MRFSLSLCMFVVCEAEKGKARCHINHMNDVTVSDTVSFRFEERSDI